MSSSDEPRYRRSGSAISARVLGETVILDLDRNRYTRLNGSAGLLWETLAEPRSTDQLAAELIAEYGIESSRADADAHALIAGLRETGLLEEAPGEPAAGR
jgi:hypothetical protein